MTDEKGPGGSGMLDALLGSGAQPGGAGGTDFAAAEAAVRQLLDDQDAMTKLRGFLDDGADLPSALGSTAQAVPAVAGAVSTLLSNPAVLQGVSASFGGLLGGAQPGAAAAPEGIDVSDAGALLGKLLGGGR